MPRKFMTKEEFAQYLINTNKIIGIKHSLAHIAGCYDMTPAEEAEIQKEVDRLNPPLTEEEVNDLAKREGAK